VDSRELLEILSSARSILSDASCWAAAHIAADVNGRWVPVGSDDARRFNLQGAVIRAAGYRARETMKAVESALGGASSATFARVLTSPQAMTHTEALEWLDAAISSLTPQLSEEAMREVAGSGVRLRFPAIEDVPRNTTGTDDTEDD
jgi:hypothetical protein